MLCRIAISLLLLLAFSSTALGDHPSVIPVYAYHADPPFVISDTKRTGVNYDLIKAMQSAAPELKFEYRYKNRQSINKLLEAGEPMIVMWTNPAWFQKSADQYLWSESLFWDKDIVVAKAASDFQYRSVADLKGLRLGGRKGYSYSGIDMQVSLGSLERLDVGNDGDNIQQLLDNKVDVIIISKSSFLYYVRNRKLFSDVKILGKPHTSYQRKLLVSSHYKDIFPQINQMIEKVIQQDYWRNRIMLYGLHDLFIEPQ